LYEIAKKAAEYQLIIFIRMNADRDATDYKKEMIKISSG